jgi:phospholipid transport system substrate-binding protein
MAQVNPRCVGRWLSILAIVLGAASIAQAGPVTDQLKGDLGRVFRVIDETSAARAGSGGIDISARRAAIRTAAAPAFDWREMASRSLGLHWQKRTEEEREEFVKVFGELVERAHIAQLERYSGEAIKYVGERVEGDLAMVYTRFVTKQSKEIPVDYRLINNRDARWRIYDLVVEGVSLVSNYRSQFDKTIRTSSYGELLKRLRAQEVASR